MITDNNNNTQSDASTPVVAVETGRFGFIMPYIAREFGDSAIVVATPLPDTVDPQTVVRAVMLSTTDIYGATEGRMLNEQTPVDTACGAAAAEQAFTQLWHSRGVETVVMRLANPVGTGMDGLPMRLAAGIKRGTMTHIADNEAMLSTVHAVDVASLSRLLPPGVYNVTDGTETRIDDLIEALAWRIGQRRVFTLKPRWARLLYGGEFYRLMTSTLTFANGNIARVMPDFKFNRVTDYLRTHVYDQSSL